MKKQLLLSLIILTSAAHAAATSTVGDAIVACRLSEASKLEELSLSFVQKTEPDGEYSDYVMSFSYNRSKDFSDIFGDQYEASQTIFHSANAQEDWIESSAVDEEGTADDDYRLVMIYTHSEVALTLTYVNRNLDGSANYQMTIEGDGPAYDYIIDNVNDKLVRSEKFSSGEDLICQSNFDLRDFVTRR